MKDFVEHDFHNIDGVKLSYLRAGNRFSVIILHGLGVSGEYFKITSSDSSQTIRRDRP